MDQDTVGGFDPLGASKYVGFSRSTLYEKMSAGEIGFIKVGRRTIIPRTELDAFLARNIIHSSKESDAA